MPEFQDVLRRDDREIRGGSPDAAHHAPAVSLFLRHIEVFNRALLRFLRHGIEPSENRFIVVCACVGNAFERVFMRFISAVSVTVKCKLLDLHARKARRFQKIRDVLSLDAQVLRDDALLAELLPDLLEEIKTRALLPAPVHRGRIAVRDRIVARKAAEMVDPHDVVETAHVADSRDPPFISVCLHFIPVKERIAPELSVRREVIRRAPGDLNRRQVLIELELIRIGPDIDAVG